MVRAFALAFLLVSCGTTVGVTAATSPPRAPTASPSPTATPSPARSPLPSPSVSVAPPPPSTSIPLVLAPSTGGPRAAEPPGRLHYVAVGASDTVGVGSLDPANGSWPSRVAALLPAGSTYSNTGVSGSLTAQARRDQLPLAVAEQPTVVSIWLAVNDLNALVPAADHAAALTAILDGLAQGTSAKLFVGNVPDLRAVPVYAAADPAVLLGRIQAYNAGISAAVAKHAGHAVLVDLFGGSAELVSDIAISGDGFHPSDAGYALIAARFADAMRKAGVPLRPGP